MAMPRILIPRAGNQRAPPQNDGHHQHGENANGAAYDPVQTSEQRVGMIDGQFLMEFAPFLPFCLRNRRLGSVVIDLDDPGALHYPAVIADWALGVGYVRDDIKSSDHPRAYAGSPIGAQHDDQRRVPRSPCDVSPLTRT